MLTFCAFSSYYVLRLLGLSVHWRLEKCGHLTRSSYLAHLRRYVHPITIKFQSYHRLDFASFIVERQQKDWSFDLLCFEERRISPGGRRYPVVRDGQSGQ